VGRYRNINHSSLFAEDINHSSNNSRSSSRSRPLDTAMIHWLRQEDRLLDQLLLTLPNNTIHSNNLYRADELFLVRTLGIYRERIKDRNAPLTLEDSQSVAQLVLRHQLVTIRALVPASLAASMIDR
jgi:hypothetical protein